MGLAEGGGSSNFWYLRSSRNRQKSCEQHYIHKLLDFLKSGLPLRQAATDKLRTALGLCRHAQTFQASSFQLHEETVEFEQGYDPALKSIFTWKWRETLFIHTLFLSSATQNCGFRVSAWSKKISNLLQGLLRHSAEPAQHHCLTCSCGI